MNNNDQISYYCFNKACKGSVYARDTVEILHLPINELTLAHEHYCSNCNAKLVSIIDIELRQAFSKNRAHPAWVRTTQRVQY